MTEQRWITASCRLRFNMSSSCFQHSRESHARVHLWCRRGTILLSSARAGVVRANKSAGMARSRLNQQGYEEVINGGGDPSPSLLGMVSKAQSREIFLRRQTFQDFCEGGETVREFGSRPDRNGAGHPDLQVPPSCSLLRIMIGQRPITQERDARGGCRLKQSETYARTQ